MTTDEFERWWRHHIAVAFPNVRAWLSNQCSCSGEHDKTNPVCPATGIKKSWQDVLACCDFEDAMAATKECQATREFRSVMAQDHPAEVRSVALHLAAARNPAPAVDDLLPLSKATPAQLDTVRGELRHAMRTLVACVEMRAVATTAGFGELGSDRRRHWHKRLADASHVKKSGSVEEHADRVIDGTRNVYSELMEELDSARGGFLMGDDVVVDRPLAQLTEGDE